MQCGCNVGAILREGAILFSQGAMGGMCPLGIGITEEKRIFPTQGAKVKKDCTLQKQRNILLLEAQGAMVQGF